MCVLYRFLWMLVKSIARARCDRLTSTPRQITAPRTAWIQSSRAQNRPLWSENNLNGQRFIRHHHYNVHIYCDIFFKTPTLPHHITNRVVRIPPPLRSHRPLPGRQKERWPPSEKLAKDLRLRAQRRQLHVDVQGPPDRGWTVIANAAVINGVPGLGCEKSLF